MGQIKNILFPVDFSDRTCNAASFVADYLKRFGAKATILHVVEPVPYAAYADAVPVGLDLDALQDDARAYLNRSLVREFANLPVDRVVEVGFAADVITKFAQADSADLIMMPSHGYGPFRSFLLGSITAKVLHDAHCPVWTATHTEESASKEHLACKQVLCAVDSSDKSLPLLKWAAGFASEAGAGLRVIHVLARPSNWVEHIDHASEQEMRRRARGEVEKLLAAAGVEAPICIAVGEVASTLRREAISHRIDTVVIGRGILHERFGRLRAHSYEIIRTAPCPVISV